MRKNGDEFLFMTVDKGMMFQSFNREGSYKYQDVTEVSFIDRRYWFER